MYHNRLSCVSYFFNYEIPVILFVDLKNVAEGSIVVSMRAHNHTYLDIDGKCSLDQGG